ncbi:Glyoxalase/Bleomycin resistance protein/Dihydroxybiphenyl dioxygenase [Polychytrium aggregatum]|uniref:Glyoxalase/Bleomycin resistance protein/Dihydroxybiphenyl dioxygenase n=1 Tax=Polychytrium aggregatum TaxID=110093 RepID=UPI0022FF3300|nr:Glyoxalase/Bleomycin resistance protein/Dihydroxybiphenyl dioxygenase [Polychytrium aggregatum]KAI9208084.1 Glyoxalase/Bleomycin resistance protein/Dihydroxybiphenyl dioxygenase [Polychytrium aggregatum]
MELCRIWTTPDELQRYLVKEVPAFIATIETRITPLVPELPSLFLDHVCLRTSTPQEYTRLVWDLLPPIATLLVESIVGGRSIATFKLKTAILAGERLVDVIEIPAPKAGSAYSSGLEHAEFVVPGSLDDFVHSRHPDLVWDLGGYRKTFNREARLAIGAADGRAAFSVKFHEMPLETVIEIEKRQGPP